MKDRTRRWLIEAIQAARVRENFDLWAYVIMPEHAHLLIYPRERGSNISRILWRIKRPVGQRAVSHLARVDPEWLAKHLVRTRSGGTPERMFWQAGGGYDRNVTEIQTILKVIDYIHSNPVRRGLAVRPEDWDWSSARWYAGVRPVLLDLDATLPVQFEV